MAERGLGQADVDEMELWVVASILGFDDDNEERLLTEREQRMSDAQMNAARVRAAELGEPMPDFEPTGPIIDEHTADDMLAHLRAARAARKAAG